MTLLRLDILGVLLLLTGLILDIAGITTTDWSSFGDPTNYVGLFRVCLHYESRLLCVDWASRSPAPELYGVWALTIPGVLTAACATLVTLGRQLLIKREDFGRKTALLVLVTATISGALTVSGIVLYALRIHNVISEAGLKVRFGSSFFLAFTSFIFIILGGVVVFLGHLRYRRPSRRRRSRASAGSLEGRPVDNVQITDTGPQPPPYEFESTEDSPPKYQMSWRSPDGEVPASSPELRHSQPEVFCITGTDQSGVQFPSGTAGQSHAGTVGRLECPPSYEETMRYSSCDTNC